MKSVLIVDDEPTISWALEQALRDEGYDVRSTASAEEARNLLQARPADLVITDVRLPGMDGLQALPTFRGPNGLTPVIVMTAFGSLETAVSALHQGAVEYLAKPFDLDHALATVRRALAHAESQPAQHVAEGGPLDSLLIGSSPPMQSVFRKIALVANQDVPVLIHGESGTGKELVAIALHRHSPRSRGPFVPICVPTLNESLIESELFGHVGGSFTGAQEDRRGLLSLADGGIAFFDEIGDISPATQVKLLRVLETKTLTPVGSNQPVKSDFRCVAATNRPLEKLVATGKFREDLFYRLNVFSIDLPPLRDRREDIPLLAKHFLQETRSPQPLVLTESALEDLMSRPWRGNVRELRNVLEHASIMARSGRIEADCLPLPNSPSSEEAPIDGTLSAAVMRWLNLTPLPWREEGMINAFLRDVEPFLIRHALVSAHGNRQEAAKLLGIHRQTLREKLRKYGLDSDDET